MPQPDDGLPGIRVAFATMILALAGLGWLSMNHSVALDCRSPAQRDAPTLPDFRIDLNSAEAARLGLLPGVGPRLAERIVRDRSVNGPFASLDDLDRVPGIGARTIERLRPFALVENSPHGIGPRTCPGGGM